MPTINYAEKYSPVVDERFTIGPLTSGMVNGEYDWIGVETVNVYSIPTAQMNNYSLTGSSRYGTPEELENAKQELKVTQDRSFTFTIDRKSHDDTMMVMEAGRALRRQLDQVVIPEVDAYRIAAYVAGCKAAHVHNSVDPSASNAYALFLAAQEDLDNAKVPQGGRFALVTPAFLNYIKQCDGFIKKGDMSQEITITGVVGEIDGVLVIKAPASYFPLGIHCVLTNRMVMPSPVKLQDYKIHQDPPGINGWLVEGRIRYDAFILNEKADAIAVIGASGSSTGAGVTVSPATLSITGTASATLVGQTLPANRAITWTSSNTAKATVENGVVTGVAAGTCTITATAVIDGQTYTDTCAVTVS